MGFSIKYMFPLRHGRNLLSTILLLLLFTTHLPAQSTKVKGRVTDASNGEGIPFVSLYFVGTTKGVSSDMDGYYTMETRDPNATTLRADIVGYNGEERSVNVGAFNEINFALTPQENILSQIIVKPDNRYLNSILRKIEEAKLRNNPEERERYDCRIYNKMELDITNADLYLRAKFLSKHFGFVLDYMDTSVVSGMPYLPIMISETNSHFYKQKNPSKKKEIIEASKISGIKDEATLAQFTGNMHLRINFYDNFIRIFDLMIPSPISGPNVYYDYYLIDSLNIEGSKVYKIRFHPAKSISTPALDGEMAVNASDFAIREIHARLPKGTNINWIRDLVLDSEYSQLEDSTWFYKQEKLYADFSVTMRDSSDMISFIATRQTDYMSPQFDTPMPDNVSRMVSNVSMSKNVLVEDEEYWQSVRPYALSTKESNIYRMVDSIKSVPIYNNIYNFVSTLINGYYDLGGFGVGPYYKLFSFNNLEGARFQFGGRTTSDLSKKVRLTGYVAYGTKDRDFKGSGTIEYYFNNQPTKKIILTAKRDVVQLGLSPGAFTESNILSSVLSKGNSQRLCPVNEFSIAYQHEWNEGINTQLALEERRIYSNQYVPMYTPDSTHVTNIGSTQLHFTARLSKEEAVTRGVFDKYYVSTKYPVVTIDLTGGIKGMGKNDYSYFRAEASINYTLRLPPAGSSKFNLSGGRIIGKVPFPLLKLHEGNGSYVFDPSAFACMDYYEFASDTWAQLFWEHNFMGFFLGKIPLLNRLKWREVLSLKVAYGTLSKSNNGLQAPLLFPEGMGSLRKPYMEMGIGITNILRVFRVDCFWRMTHRTKEINGTKQRVDHLYALNIGIELSF